jgi:murein DD-endopeptidase MepM/ murein hydrolase activator NlpD
MNRISAFFLNGILASFLFMNGPPAFGGDTYFDWPMGSWAGEELVLGENVTIMQEFRNVNPYKDNKQHAGVDLNADTGVDLTDGLPVYAAADGVVLCDNTAKADALQDYPGRVVVIQHTLNDGKIVYSMYGHLADLLVSPGDEVRRGDQIGSIIYQKDLSHLHFEIRGFSYWSGKLGEPIDQPPEDRNDQISCAGPGYKPHGERTLEDYGWLDPVEFYYNHRPPYPRAVVLNGRLSVAAPGDPAPPERRKHAVYPEPMFGLEPITFLPGFTVVTAVGVETTEDDERRYQTWYRVKYDGVNLGYILGHYYDWWDGDIRVGEPLGLWIPPESEPLIEYRFDRKDFHQGFITNWGSLGKNANGTFMGNSYYAPGPNVPEDINDSSLLLDGQTAFVEVNNSQRLPFSSNGIILETLIRRYENEDEDAVLSKWYNEQDEWLLTFYPDVWGKLIFVVRLSDGSYTEVDYLLPDAEYLGPWAHVAARYDPWDGIRLYWDGELVAQKIVSDLEAEGHGVGDRLVLRGSNFIHVGDAGNEWSRFKGQIDNVRIWTTDRSKGTPRTRRPGRQDFP